MKLLQRLCNITTLGVLLSIATHLRLYTHNHTFYDFIWTFVLSLLLSLYIFLILASLHMRISNITTVRTLSPKTVLRNAVKHGSRWNHLLLGLGVVVGSLGVLSFIAPTPLSPAPHSLQSLSAMSIWLYTVLFLVSVHFRWRYLDWVLTRPSIADHWEAVMVAAKLQEPSAIPPLLGPLREAAWGERDRIVAALTSVGDTRTLFPLLSLLETTPPYAQKPLKKAIQTACHAIHSVTFGTVPPARFNPDQTLTDYEFSTSVLPLRKLKRIGISTTDYQFAQVERFLTYVVNTLGQRTLKHHVIVEVYGEPTHLHQNLLNTLTNLCQRVIVYRHEDVETAKQGNM